MNGIKIAVIGGGSSYTPELASGLVKRAGVLPVEELVLVDIPEGGKKLGIVTELVKRIFEKEGLATRVTATLDRQEALKGCSFVITQFRVGGLEARSTDERIPLKYRVIGQETTGPGGFAKALRTVPVALSIAKDMERLCPGAWLINFTNPSGIVTEALNKYSNIRNAGLCNVPINMERDLAEQLGVSHEDVYCEFVGLNHLSWIKRVFVRGLDKTEELFERADFEKSIVSNIPPVQGASELIKTLRLIPSPYLDYYYFENQMFDEELESFNKGMTRADEVMKVEKELFSLYADERRTEVPPELSERGGSLYSEVALSTIESIFNDLGRVIVLNTPNKGAITGIDADSVVETNCVVNRAGLHPLATGELPLKIRSLVYRVKTYEQLTVEAAVSGSRESAFLALLNHPLVHGAKNASLLLDEILSVNKRYLPQFA